MTQELTEAGWQTIPSTYVICDADDLTLPVPLASRRTGAADREGARLRVAGDEAAGRARAGKKRPDPCSTGQVGQPWNS